MQSQDVVTMLVRISGHFSQNAFVPWIQERSDRLGLTSSLGYCSNELIEVTASGHEILVDALALACSLGPVAATVDDVESILLNSDLANVMSARKDD